MICRLGTKAAVAATIVLAVVVACAHAAAGAESSVVCGGSRPALESITTAEGLVIAPDGTIYFSQPFVGENQTFLGRYAPPYDHPPETRWLDLGGNALGITLDPGRNLLYAGSRTARKLFAVTLGETPRARPLAEVEDGINGVTLGPDGAVYYSDQTGGHVYRISPEGVKTRVTATPLVEPNGLAFSNEGALYAVSWAGPEVTRLFLEHGAEARRETFAMLPRGHADGIAFDARGRAYVTASSTLYEISPDGKDVTPLGRTAGANIDFGAGALSCSDMYVAGNGQGLRLFRHDTPGLDVPWHQAPPAPALTSLGPPQVSFPGQYAPQPPAWKYPSNPKGCDRFAGDDKAACLRFVALDFGQLARFAAANAVLAAPRPNEKRVVFFGDSITDNWSKDGYGGFFPGKGYVNRGIGGQTTAQMLLRFRTDVLALRPAVVVILAGTNDVSGNAGPMSPAAIEDNLADMAELARVHGVRVVLASITPVADDKLDRFGHPMRRSEGRPLQTLQALNAWIADYARKNGHVHLDYWTALADAQGAFQVELNGDGLHPNAKGYAVMGPLAERAIAEALRK
jgi:lysophospholipase L1-like esterase/streptogramin lyase